MGRSTASRQPIDGEYRQRMIRFFMQKKWAETLVIVGFVMLWLKP